MSPDPAVLDSHICGGIHAESLLIIKPSSLGDIIHALPCVAAIRDAWPATRISWVVNSEFAGILENNPLVDRVLPFPRNHFRGPKGFLQALPWFFDLRKEGASLALDLQGLLRSALMGKASQAGILMGLSDAREGARVLQDRTVLVDPRAHAVDRMLAVLPELGIRKPDSPKFVLPEKRPAGKWDEPFLALHPFSRGTNKSLRRKILRQICRKMSGYRVVLVGRGEWTQPMEGVINLLNGTTLPELVWILRRAAGVISVDSGPAHIAAAVNPEVLSIHTWSDPARVGPYGKAAFVWKGGEIARLSDLSQAARQQTRNVEEADVVPICAWAVQRIEGQKSYA